MLAVSGLQFRGRKIERVVFRQAPFARPFQPMKQRFRVGNRQKIFDKLLLILSRQIAPKIRAHSGGDCLRGAVADKPVFNVAFVHAAIEINRGFASCAERFRDRLPRHPAVAVQVVRIVRRREKILALRDGKTVVVQTHVINRLPRPRLLKNQRRFRRARLVLLERARAALRPAARPVFLQAEHFRRLRRLFLERRLQRRLVKNQEADFFAQIVAQIQTRFLFLPKQAELVFRHLACRVKTDSLDLSFVAAFLFGLLHEMAGDSQCLAVGIGAALPDIFADGAGVVFFERVLQFLQAVQNLAGFGVFLLSRGIDGFVVFPLSIGFRVVFDSHSQPFEQLDKLRAAVAEITAPLRQMQQNPPELDASQILIQSARAHSERRCQRFFGRTPFRGDFLMAFGQFFADNPRRKLAVDSIRRRLRENRIRSVRQHFVFRQLPNQSPPQPLGLRRASPHPAHLPPFLIFGDARFGVDHLLKNAGVQSAQAGRPKSPLACAFRNRSISAIDNRPTDGIDSQIQAENVIAFVLHFCLLSFENRARDSIIQLVVINLRLLAFHNKRSL